MFKHPTDPIFPLFFLLFSSSLAAAENTTIPINVGVVLDLETRLGKMGMSCIDMALSDFYSSHGYYSTRLILHTRDSMSDVVVAAAAGSSSFSYFVFLFSNIL